MINSSAHRTSVAKSFSLTRRITSRMPGALTTTTVDGKVAYRWTADNGTTWQNWLQHQRRPRSSNQRSAGGRAAFSLMRGSASPEPCKPASLLDPMLGLRWITRTFF